MELFNVGPMELIIFLILAFLVLGPKGMIQTAYKVGAWIRKAVRSPMWREMLNYSQEIRDLPKKIMDDTGLEAELKSVRATTNEALREVNTSIKDAADAARVPEMEHLRIETGRPPSALPAEKPMSGVLPYATSSAAVMPNAEVSANALPTPAAQIVPAASNSPASEAEPIIDPRAAAREDIAQQSEPLADDASLSVDQPAQAALDQPDGTPQAPATVLSVTSLGSGEPLPAPAPRKRAKRTPAVDSATASVDAPVSTEELTAPAPRKRAKRKPAVDSATASEDAPVSAEEPSAVLPVADFTSASAELPVSTEDPSASAPRKRTKRTPAVLPVVDSTSTSEEPPVSAEEPPASAPRKRTKRTPAADSATVREDAPAPRDATPSANADPLDPP